MYEFSDSPIFSVEPNPTEISLLDRIFADRSSHSRLSRILGKIIAGIFPTESSWKYSVCRSESVIIFGIEWVGN